MNGKNQFLKLKFNMKKAVYINAYDIISPLGNGIAENWSNLLANKSGINITNYNQVALPLGKIKNYSIKNPDYTFLENLIIDSINNTLSQTDIQITDPTFLLIISSTKGNIDLLNESLSQKTENIRLSSLATTIQQHFNLANTPLIISNACVSGVMATSIAKSYLHNNLYSNIMVCGADILSNFVIEGFLSFKAISNELCKPFDEDRNGINLGETVASILLSTNKLNDSDIAIVGAGSSNDANHISGPSRTGDGLALAIKSAISEADIDTHQIGFISAHGTATLFNDEMESKALELVKLNHIPINSFKSYIGHTLGAAGIVEIIYTILSMNNNVLIKSLGCQNTTYPINVIKQNMNTEVTHSLKLSSGFGGCNSVLILAKI